MNAIESKSVDVGGVSSPHRHRSLHRSLGFAMLFAALGLGRALAAEITLPADTVTFIPSPLPGYATAQAMCATCHSADYPLYQPRTLNRTFWKNEVIKMQKTYGAPIPPSEFDALTDYLVKTYGAERGAPATTPAPTAPSAPAPKK